MLKMNVYKKLSALLCFLIAVELAESVLQCCTPNVSLSSSTEMCIDWKNVTISCKSKRIVNSDWGTYYHYIIANDSEGAYLDAYIAGYIIREPHFCINNMTSRYSGKTVMVAMVCTELREWYHEMEIATGDAKTEINLLNILSIVIQIINAFSFLLLFVCAFIYGGVLPQLRDTQGKCYFYFTLNAALGHAALAYVTFFNTTKILPDLCITNLYVIMYLFLSCFSWTFVLSFNTWRQTRSSRIVDESELMNRYMYIGYGTPLVLLIFGFIHVHLVGISDKLIEWDCYAHQHIIYNLYVVLPIFVLLVANAGFFIDCQRLLWNAYAIKQTVSEKTLRILKYRCLLNMKLFFMMGLPWLIDIVIFFISTFIFNPVFEYLMFITEVVIAGEGIFIFLILVVSRTRVLKIIANEWFANSSIFPRRWKTMKDLEAEQATENEEHVENDFKVHYNVVDNETVKTDIVVNIDKQVATNLIGEV